MKVETLQYTVKNGWKPSVFPDLDSENTVVFIFCSPCFLQDQAPIQTLMQHYPKSKIIGCSTAGEIYGDGIFDKSVSVAIAKFEKTTVITATSHELGETADSFSVGADLGSQLNHRSEKLAGIFVLSEGIKINGSELIRGLNSRVTEYTVVTGGLAGDNSHFKETFVISDGKLSVRKVVAIGLYGDHVKISHGSRGGWDIFGIERRVTHSKKNILYTLDQKPALTLYKEYLGEKAKDLPASGLLFPLSIRKDAQDEKRLVRTILGVDEKEGALIFAGDIPEGYLAQLMHANFDRLISAAKDAGESLLNMLEETEAETGSILVIAISCVGRRLLLGERTEEEVKSTLDIFPDNTKMVGFYSYGEISPHTSGKCDLHNQTMTLTSFSERKNT